MNMKIEEIYPSRLSGFNVVYGTVNGKDFTAQIEEGTRKLESIKIEETYIYVQDKETTCDVKFVEADEVFVSNFQTSIILNTKQLSAR